MERIRVIPPYFGEKSSLKNRSSSVQFGLTTYKQQELLVAEDEAGKLFAFVQYRHRKDDRTTLYNIVVAQTERTKGIGCALMDVLADEARTLRKQFILLKCPQELPANGFYRHYGFELQGIDTGKYRPLNIWILEL